jgi:hypothetical protein
MAVFRTVHAKFLRVIGQSLETAGIETFEIDSDGERYVVSSESVTENGAWILRNCVGNSSVLRKTDEDRGAKISLRLDSTDLARLDAQGQRKRGESGSRAQSPSSTKSSGVTPIRELSPRKNFNSWVCIRDFAEETTGTGSQSKPLSRLCRSHPKLIIRDRSYEDPAASVHCSILGV